MAEANIRLFDAGDRDRLIDQHQRLYAASDGFDDSFGALVGEIIDGFLAGADASQEAGWVAEEQGTRLGTIFCFREGHAMARLRLFFLVPEARGKGLGRRLLCHCMGFAEARGYRGMCLWTHESHRAAGALYRATGWTLTAAHQTRSFGQQVVEQHWEYRF
jgi:GNAT superfamily N-acetyltransferase